MDILFGILGFTKGKLVTFLGVLSLSPVKPSTEPGPFHCYGDICNK